MQSGGVQKQGELGMRHGPPVPKPEPLGMKGEGLVTADGPDFEALFEAVEIALAKAEEEVDYLLGVGTALYVILKDIVGDHCESHAEFEKSCTHCVAVGALAAYADKFTVTPEDEEAQVGILCPECGQGKHQNCTMTVLAEDDTIIPCACSLRDHADA